MSYSLKQLKDRALDVDPDIRYMAIEDLRKALDDTSTNVDPSALLLFIPILLDMLKDENPDVKGKAIQVFEPIARNLSGDKQVSLIGDLFDLVNKEVEAGNDSDTLTISVPTLGLRSIFNGNISFTKPVSKQIIDIISQGIHSRSMNIDYAEILCDVYKHLGVALSDKEIQRLATELIKVAYSKGGIIGKRSITSFSYLLKHLRSSQVFNGLIEEISTSSPSTTTLALYSVVLNKEYGAYFQEESVRRIFEDIKRLLKSESVNEVIDYEEMDLDVIVHDNGIRDEALGTLNNFVTSLPYHLVEDYITEVVQIVQTFLQYNPGANNQNEDYDYDDSEEDSDVEFSDEDDALNDDANDDDYISWKLRLRSLSIIDSMLKSFPQNLLPLIYSDLVPLEIKALDDENELVSVESIRTLTHLITKTADVHRVKRRNSDISIDSSSSPLNILIDKYTPGLLNSVYNQLSTEKNLNKVPIILALIESLIKTITTEFDPDYLTQLLVKSRELKIENDSIDILHLIKTLLKVYLFDDIPPDFRDYIVTSITNTISKENSAHIALIECSSIARELFKQIKLSHTLSLKWDYVNDLFLAIEEKVSNYKSYSSDIRQKFILAYSECLKEVEVVDKARWFRIFETFKNCLNLEISVNVTLTCLIDLLGGDKEASVNWDQFNSNEEFINYLSNRLVGFLSTSDSALFNSSLVLLVILNEHHKMDNPSALLTILTRILFGEENSTLNEKQLSSIFELLKYNISQTDITEETIKLFATKVVNNLLNKGEDEDDIGLSSFEGLLTSLSSLATFDVFEVFSQNLDLKLAVSSRILATITHERQLNERITLCEDAILNHLNGRIPLSEDKLLFDVQFIGNIGYLTALDKMNVEVLLELLDKTDNELVKVTIGRSIGLILFREIDTIVPKLLEYYVEYPDKRTYLLHAIKQSLVKSETISPGLATKVWQTVWTTTESYTDLKLTNIPELRCCGDVLALADKFLPCFELSQVLQHALEASGNNISVIYVLNVILKHRITSKEEMAFTDKVINLYIDKLPVLFNIMDVDVQQILMGNLLACLHNRQRVFLPKLNDLVIPLVLQELTAKEEFKRIIPMGPYKYVLDEGLEARKLCYEFLYTITSISYETLKEYDINLNIIGESFIEKGLSDKENDIIVFSTINLKNLLNNPIASEYQFLITQDHHLLNKLIQGLNGCLKKPLKAKPTKQEVDSHEEVIKSVMELIKSVNSYLLAEDHVTSKWPDFYTSLR
ncbi:uncharacterized protein KQ657_000258 [Scheffersomyces spartinae]|uniref:TATA-binding protein interacting (TIP20) domain-containing protein n=1 Tax=Scheffersomyces spartinae TaxID=45513 RepID=A0A9P8AK94_9ASCO|nr:uncharacterized protein KQ657_000258 [Scheffersomyces spartinae]KAG7196245.1 hypothetical protein KQ657_000258 [Scheffersomyces spartinae]